MTPEQLSTLAAKAPVLQGNLPAVLLPDRELHIDGDYAAYYYSGNDDTSLAAAKANMLDAFRNVRQIGAVGGRVVVHLSAAGTDKGKRYRIATVKDYQGQRDSGRKPKNWQGMRTFLETALPSPEFITKIWHDREADDGVAAASRYAIEKGLLPVIFSRDKDFRMMPGLHVVWTTYDTVRLLPGQWEVIGPDGEVYGQKWFWMQMLQGDAADNIPGLEGIRGGKGFKSCGPACALKVLAGATNAEEAFFATFMAYSDYYGADAQWTDRFVEQAALLWMRTDNKADVADFTKALPSPTPEAINRAIQRLRDRL